MEPRLWIAALMIKMSEIKWRKKIRHTNFSLRGKKKRTFWDTPTLWLQPILAYLLFFFSYSVLCLSLCLFLIDWQLLGKGARYFSKQVSKAADYRLHKGNYVIAIIYSYNYTKLFALRSLNPSPPLKICSSFHWWACDVTISRLQHQP
jgi:hypothetical protein